ncbi:MAG: transposase [Alphaproteobacteria bacterium]|nr:transposase [Alphaproteobacteria bacterium]
MGYPSNLRDGDWDVIKHHFSTGNYGNRAIHSRLSLVNGILYVVKTGCQWRSLLFSTALSCEKKFLRSFCLLIRAVIEPSVPAGKFFSSHFFRFSPFSFPLSVTIPKAAGSFTASFPPTVQ